MVVLLKIGHEEQETNDKAATCNTVLQSLKTAMLLS